jgi:hypothetical protein
VIKAKVKKEWKHIIGQYVKYGISLKELLLGAVSE